MQRATSAAHVWSTGTAAEATADWRLIINFSTFVDPSSSRLYALEVVCSTKCYEAAEPQIDKLVNSWRIG